MKTPSIRSILFVPADSERKIEKSATSGADAVVLDLEDSVSQSRLGYARDLVLRYLSDTGRPRKQQLWVRVNPLRSAFILDDLAAVVRGAPDAMLLPKCAGGADVTILDHYLTALERRDCIDPGHIRIVPVATESPEAMFGLNSYKGCSERLLGLTWGAEDLASAVGASTNKHNTGTLAFTYQLARSLCLLGARSAQVLPIDGVCPDFRDTTALETEVVQARRDGFTAKFAIHPAQIEPINQGFMPDATEVGHARAVIQAFNKHQDQGAVQLNGAMLDKPHLLQAQRTLALFEAYQEDGDGYR